LMINKIFIEYKTEINKTIPYKLISNESINHFRGPA